jgi:hypothetical protein
LKPTTPAWRSFEADVAEHIDEIAYQRLASTRGRLMLHFNLLPTDPRIRSLRDWECEVHWRTLELEATRRKRVADGLPATSFDDLTGDKKFAKEETALDQQWAIEAAEAAAAALTKKVPDATGE